MTMNRKAIIAIVAVIATALSAILLTSDEQSGLCQSLCGQAEAQAE